MMKRVHKKTKLNFKDWDLETIEDMGHALNSIILKAAGEIVELGFEHPDTHCYFPIEWAEQKAQEGGDGSGGRQVTDPLTLYICIAIGKEMSTVAFKTNLRECLEGTMEACREDGSYRHGLRLLGDALHKLATEINDATLEGLIMEKVEE